MIPNGISFDFFIFDPVRKRNRILFFLSLLLAGYCCQIGRFCTAFKQYNVSHTYEKGLTKRVLALRLSATNSFTDKKFLTAKKQQRNSNPFSTSAAADPAFCVSAIGGSFTYHSHPDYFPPFLFSSGERGPPAFA